MEENRKFTDAFDVLINYLDIYDRSGKWDTISAHTYLDTMYSEHRISYNDWQKASDLVDLIEEAF